MPKQMPENWEPPVDAWQSAFDGGIEEVVFAYFGTQRPKGVSASEFEDQFHTAFAGNSPPSFVTRAEYVDASGYENDLFIAYWPGQAAFDAWWQGSTLKNWWQASERESGPHGFWREIFTVSTKRFETLHSSKCPTGVAHLAKEFGEPVREHNYWGGMRDRVPDSAQDNFPSKIGDRLPEPKLAPSHGQRLATKLPDNLCLIRSGQNWRDCSDEELETYLDVVKPKLTAAMAYLRDNPVESGCASCRLMDETALDGSLAAQSFGLAMFISMEHLENWSKSHPTHLAIFGNFFKMVEKHEGQLDLKLWHEVLIIDGDKSLCEYVNCHANSGLLPYFRS
ncbi:phenylacetaldoxime dehydratase family protein [Parasphingorhabdus sp.]|uniref:phenylacetaldoxime dehydratase family protein n=1 Tax=Parasphingorhabdus sp. TaxID=2709688 RepID=UPI0032667F55